MRRRLPAGLLILAIVTAGLGLGTAADAAKPKPKAAQAKRKCSSLGMSARSLTPLKAPAKVRLMHHQILEAAATCDFKRLQRLALQGRKQFDFTFGDEKWPGPYWERAEAKGGTFLRRMMQVMRLDFAKDGRTYVWPAAAARSASEEDWEGLIPMFGERQMVVFRDYGGYTDARVGITEDGDWIFAVDGD